MILQMIIGSRTMSVASWPVGGICFICVLFCCLNFPSTVEGGCADIGKCCPGRNNKCNFTVTDHSSLCYCDEFCSKSQDCCSDYEYYCRRQDCMLEYWGHWTACSTRCGRGTQERTRKVHIQPTSGGKPCDPLRQVRTCYDTGPHCARKEIALLLPTYYKPHRKIPNKYFPETKAERPSYCIRYHLTYVSPYCQYDTPWHMMKKNDVICVECEDTAMNDAGKCKGAYTRTSGSWKGVATHYCYGSWKSEADVEENCECGYKHGYDFIFV